jgi:hypothetical protein
MSRYSVSIPRCTHIKTNGTQCGSPALRGRRFCFFHKNWRGQRIQLDAKLPAVPATFTLPVLEDANSVQIALMQVIHLLLSGRIDSKTAGLLLYALQTASLNLKQTDLEPRAHERVVIDPSSVNETALGENAWDEQDFQDEDAEEDEDDETGADDANDDGIDCNEASNEEEDSEEEDSEEDDDGRPDQDFALLLLERLGLPPLATENDKADDDRAEDDQNDAAARGAPKATSTNSGVNGEAARVARTLLSAKP